MPPGIPTPPPGKPSTKGPVDIPHFAFPFQIAPGGHAAVLEQDSDAEIINCVELIASVPQGSLIDEPGFGVTDPTFMINPPTGLIGAQIQDWEPRAQIKSIQAPDGDDLTLDNMIIEVDTGTP